MNMTEFGSERLTIRPYQDADFPGFYRLASDPVAMHFIREAATEPAPVIERINAMKAYREQHPGLGSFIIFRRSDGLPLGNMVLRHADWNPEREIEAGYVIDPAFWGQGIASEALKALMEYAVKTMGYRFLVAFTDENNHASNRVLEKNGFQRTGTELIYDSLCLRWEISFED